MLDALFGDSAVWFTAPALLGTMFFAFRLAMMFLGLGLDLETGDAHVPGDHHGDSTEAFKFLSIQAILAFAMGFGWVGFGAFRGAGWNWPSAAALGMAGGVGMVLLLERLLRTLHGLEVSGNISIDDALGAEGQVYVTVPPAGAGRGQVRVTIGQRDRIYNAVSDAGELAPPARIRVVRVNDDHSLTVQSA